MSTIRLEEVSKVFGGSSAFDYTARGKGLSGGQVDRAFAGRVAAHTAMERDLARRAGPVVALDRVSLTVSDGQAFAVVGPSGCGKSTLLRVVAGLEDYTGHVYYDDQDMGGVPPRKRYIGMVFQNYALYPHFEGRGNLEFFFRVHKAPDAETEKRIRITAEMMGIGFKELLGRKPGTLSGGQQQRVAIARALVRRPRLFLFDEPLSNLDARLRTQTRGEIKRLLHRFGITAIYVTHDQVEALALGDQIAVMRDGRIEQVGAYKELQQNPVNDFVAGFLGSPPMNLLTGGTVADDVFRLGEITAPLPEAVRAQVHAGQKLTLGIRPEKAFLPSDDRPRREGIRVSGTVEVVEPDFAHRTQLVYARTGDLTYAASGALDTTLNVGDEVEVVFPAERLYFFDGESGQRL
jgi:ABC-type sugar transport system ATPase subunit